MKEAPAFAITANIKWHLLWYFAEIAVYMYFAENQYTIVDIWDIWENIAYEYQTHHMQASVNT